MFKLTKYYFCVTIHLQFLETRWKLCFSRRVSLLRYIDAIFRKESLTQGKNMAQPFKSSPNYLKSKKDHQLGIEPSVRIKEKEG